MQMKEGGLDFLERNPDVPNVEKQFTCNTTTGANSAKKAA